METLCPSWNVPFIEEEIDLFLLKTLHISGKRSHESHIRILAHKQHYLVLKTEL